MALKEQLRERLMSMRTVEGVLPTRRVEVERPETLTEIARSVVTGELEQAERSAGEQLLASLGAGVAERGALAEMADQADLREQVAGFAAAGFGFFRATQSYLQHSLRDRRAAGGNGAVIRVLLSETQLLFETPRLTMRFGKDISKDELDAAIEQHGLLRLRELVFLPGIVQAAVEDGGTLDFCLKLMEEDIVEYAEPDFIEFVGQRYQPSDPDYGRQWHLNNRGSAGGTAGSDISAENAWDTVRGESTHIAVIDNGFDVGHPDLDFDGISGWFRPTPDDDDADFIAGTSGLPSGNHGTACAGMAAAQADNNIGGCGVAFNARLSGIACLTDQVGTQSTLARTVAYAADPSLESADLSAQDGADVIACSLGPNSAKWEMRQVLSDAIDFATASGRGGHGTPIFWATTNGNFPISYDEVCSHPSVIAVGRSTHNDTDDGSGYGPELDFLAPGVDVVLPAQGGGYRTTTGTSFACPCAAGVGALALSANSGLDAQQVRQVIRDSCDKVGNMPYSGGRNDRFGHGRVNANTAVSRAEAMELEN